LIGYSAAFVSQIRDQKRFTIWKVAANWYELMIPQRIMQPSSARTKLEKLALSRVYDRDHF